MSRNARLGIAAAVLVAAVAAFVLLRPSDNETTTDTRAVSTAASDAQETKTTTQSPPPKPKVTRIRVAGGEPVGGVRAIKLHKGDRIRVTVTSDKPENAHLHGYDIKKPVGPGQPARYSVPARITGVFELELEESGVQLAKITVEP